jgi:cytochrome c oxidase assembly protein subunit 15
VDAAVPLVDLAPLARLALMAVLIALLPLSWVWLRKRNADTPTRLAALTALTLFLTFDLIVFGSFTRLTDSGLGCPDWPGCYGEASPLGAHSDIAAAQSAMPTGPVTFTKAWIEMIHRYLAMTVGVLIMVMAAVSWSERRRLPHSPWWPTLTLAWVIVQGLFGKYTVTLKLYPAIVTLHLIGGLLLLGMLAFQHEAYRRRPVALSAPWRRWRCWRSRWPWAGGSARTTPCWPAPASRSATASGGLRWISPTDSRSCGSSGVPVTAGTCRSRRWWLST